MSATDWDTVEAAFRETKNLQELLDRRASQMTRMLNGRLRNVDAWALVELKRELRRFNASTKKWQEES